MCSPAVCECLFEGWCVGCEGGSEGVVRRELLG